MDPLDRYPAMMSPTQVGEFLGVSTITLKGWRRDGKGPQYVKLGDGPNATVRYPRSAVRTYLAERTVTPVVAS
jgi:predicted DNA-binding transcriptional regulator AlpA